MCQECSVHSASVEQLWKMIITVNTSIKETAFLHSGSEFLNKNHHFYQPKVKGIGCLRKAIFVYLK